MSLFSHTFHSRPHVRQMQCRDVQSCKLLDDSPDAKDYDYFTHLLQPGRMTNGLVCVASGRPVGWVSYGYTRTEFIVQRIVVAPVCRRRGYGRMLLDELASCMLAGKQECVRIDVPDVELGVQLFLKACGFWGYWRRGCSFYQFERTLLDGVRGRGRGESAMGVGR
jgi:ribosomal protein S18 acetylase RimI-like enzyme